MQIMVRNPGWCLWEKRDLERPAGQDITRVTVDCKENLYCVKSEMTMEKSPVLY